jgi:O-methyltransferase
MDGYLVTQLLHVAASLGIADALAAGPRTSGEVAQAVGADALAVHRVLRGLALWDVVTEGADGRFGLTDTGALLQRETPGSQHGAVIARGEVYFRAAGEMLRAVREGGDAFTYAYGEPFFAHLTRHPEREAAFQASMAARSAQEAQAVLAAYDFGDVGRLVDVGGGDGTLLAAILGVAPHLRGVLLDRPGPAAAAAARLRQAGVAERCELVAGDFFEAIPAGADAYVLSRVLHDWDDVAAGRILDRVREAMGSGSRLLVVEALLPERAVERPAAIRMDLHMLMLFPQARERTEGELRDLLAGAGLRVRRVVATTSPAGLAVIEAVPASALDAQDPDPAAARQTTARRLRCVVDADLVQATT